MDLFDIAVARKLSGGGGGGGSSDVVTGTFHTGNDTETQLVQVPYDGNGFPLFVAIYPKGGALGSLSNVSHFHGMVSYFIHKENLEEPDYSTLNNGYAYVTYWYKNGSRPTSYAVLNNTRKPIYTQTEPTDAADDTVKISAKNTLKIRVSATDSNAYGFVANQDYDYIIKYYEE